MNFGKFLRTPFLQNTSGRLLVLLVFQKQPPEVFLKLLQNSQENTFGLRNFKKHLFYRTPLDDCFWLFCATLLKWDTDNSVWKTSDEYADLETLTLEVTFRYMISFFRRINFQCMFSLIYIVYCQKQQSE